VRQSIFITLAAAVFSIGTASADIVYLVNGGVLEGRVRYEDGRIVIEQPTGKVYLDSSKVDRIEKSKTEMDVFEERLADLKKKDAPAADEYTQLARYAMEHGMKARGEQMYKKALTVDSENAAARIALGYVKFQDRWMTPDEANIARGLVKHNDAWVTPEAKADLMKAEVNADAQRARASAEEAKAEQERLRLQRVDKELQLIEADRERLRDDSYYYHNVAPVVLPSGPGTPGTPAQAAPAPVAAPRNPTPPPNNLGGVINPVEVQTPDGTVRLDPSGALIIKKK
jgi:hypothetical protein